MSLDERSDDLDKRMAEHPVEKTVKTLLEADRRNRLRIRILTVSIILDIVLTVGVTVLSYHTNQLTHLAQSNREAVIANCETANESRANNKQLWDFAFALPTTQTPTPEQQANLEKFKAKVNQTFAQRDCQAEINKPLVVQ